MDQEKRSKLIRSYLKIEPITHGQLYGYQIAIPHRESVKVEDDRYGAIAASLQQHQTNVIPVIVRPTKAYNDEQEYEAICGADWLIVAEELNIERLWVWVFNLSDDQVSDFQREMAQLMTGNTFFQENSPPFSPVPPVTHQENLPETSPIPPTNFDDSEIKKMIESNLQGLTENIIKSLTPIVEQLINSQINAVINKISAAIKNQDQPDSSTPELPNDTKPKPSFSQEELEKMTGAKLDEIIKNHDICKKQGITKTSLNTKQKKIKAIMKFQA